MRKYLLDTNICIYYLNGKFELDDKLDAVGIENCYISEITVAEMKYGAEKSQRINENLMTISLFQSRVQVVPIFGAIDFYAKEKARPQKQGITVDEFDLLIGATAVTNGLVMVTNNISHFYRIDGIELEDWTKL